MSHITNGDNLVIQFTLFKSSKTMFGNTVGTVFSKNLNFFMFLNHFNMLMLKK